MAPSSRQVKTILVAEDSSAVRGMAKPFSAEELLRIVKVHADDV